MKDEITKVIGSTWFEFEDVESKSASLVSREYGDIGDEKPGTKDIAEAKRIIAALRGAGFSVTGDVVDEWVMVNARKENQ